MREKKGQGPVVFSMEHRKYDAIFFFYLEKSKVLFFEKVFFKKKIFYFVLSGCLRF